MVISGILPLFKIVVSRFWGNLRPAGAEIWGFAGFYKHRRRSAALDVCKQHFSTSLHKAPEGRQCL
jgi:hypothetical protein